MWGYDGKMGVKWPEQKHKNHRDECAKSYHDPRPRPLDWHSCVFQISCHSLARSLHPLCSEKSYAGVLKLQSNAGRSHAWHCVQADILNQLNIKRTFTTGGTHIGSYICVFIRPPFNQPNQGDDYYLTLPRLLLVIQLHHESKAANFQNFPTLRKPRALPALEFSLKSTV